MATFRYINLNIPEAELFADLVSVRTDLEVTLELCKLYRIPDDNYLLSEALMAAIIVRYARPFTTGIRKHNKQDILSELSEDERLKHDFFYHLRDKYIAHSVNAFENIHVRAYLVPEERGPRMVSGISEEHGRLTGLSLNDITILELIISKILSKVNNLIEVERERVLIAARALPVDELYSQIDIAPKSVTQADVIKSRKTSKG